MSAGTGDVTLKTLSNEEDAAKADSDAKSGKVGIGASVSVQVLNAHTRSGRRSRTAPRSPAARR